MASNITAPTPSTHRPKLPQSHNLVRLSLLPVELPGKTTLAGYRLPWNSVRCLLVGVWCAFFLFLPVTTSMVHSGGCFFFFPFHVKKLMSSTSLNSCANFLFPCMGGTVFPVLSTPFPLSLPFLFLASYTWVGEWGE
jgi:hypothetical protein